MKTSPRSKGKELMKTALLAAASIGLYALVFANEALVTEYFTMGSYYAALPIATAFLFSFVHGGFASNLLDNLGLTARKTPSVRTGEQKQERPAMQKNERPRITIN